MTRRITTRKSVRRRARAARASAADYIVIGEGETRQAGRRQKNREAQARWRERHIMKRREAQRIVNILVRKHLTDDDIKRVAVLLNQFLNREGSRTLRRCLRVLAEARTSGGIIFPTGTMDDPAAERLAWEQDHPGEEWPEHLCGLSDREYTDYQRWLRRRERQARRA